MHELSIAFALVEQVTRVAHEEKATAVVGITIAVGTLSGVDPAALEAAFPLAAEKTMLENARLTIREVPATIRCRHCQALRTKPVPQGQCESCNSDDVEITGGRELTIASVDLDVPEPVVSSEDIGWKEGQHV